MRYSVKERVENPSKDDHSLNVPLTHWGMEMSWSLQSGIVRATRSMLDGISIIQRVADREALVKVLDRPWLDLTTPMGKGMLAFLSALAEDERLRITRRANEGREAAKAKGVKFGRKPKLTEHQRQVAINRMSKGESARAIAKDLGVAHTTISRLR